MNAIIYCRVSTEEQVDSGAGLQAQEDACRGLAARLGARITAVSADEGVKGAKGLECRPALLEAIGWLRRGDVLLVAKRDRLGRDPIVVAMIESAVARKGARVLSAAGEGTDSDSPADVLMRRMVDAFSEYERLIIGARTKAALQAKISRRERVGKVRFGWNLADDGVTLVEHPDEQLVIRLIHELKSSGKSLRRIADELTRRQIVTKEGGRRWSHTAVSRILNRAA